MVFSSVWPANSTGILVDPGFTGKTRRTSFASTIFATDVSAILILICVSGMAFPAESEALTMTDPVSFSMRNASCAPIVALFVVPVAVSVVVVAAGGAAIAGDPLTLIDVEIGRAHV